MREKKCERIEISIMPAKDAELLRREYNENYSKPYDWWSCVDLDETQTIVDEIVKQISYYGFKPSDKARSLDVGCAKGYITEALRLAGFESHGLDYSDVAIRLANEKFTHCHFKHMDGFNPQYEIRFDLIFARGFSGANTHDLDFVAGFSNKYIELLTPGGFYILAYNSNFSGHEAEGETVNWSYEEIEELSNKLKAENCGMFFFPKTTFLHRCKRLLQRLPWRPLKDYFYLVYSENLGYDPPCRKFQKN